MNTTSGFSAMDELPQTQPTDSVTRPLPRTAEGRAYIVAGALLRAIDRAGLRPDPDRLHTISAIEVYRRRMAVYSVPMLGAADACRVIDRVVQLCGLDMMVMPPANSHIDFVVDLYSRDAVDYYDRF